MTTVRLSRIVVHELHDFHIHFIGTTQLPPVASQVWLKHAER
jgi:hypothetical protein